MEPLVVINALICLSASAICTTGIVDGLVFEGVVDAKYLEENFERGIKAHIGFFVLDAICAIIMLIADSMSWFAFLALLGQGIFSAWAYRKNVRIIEEMATVRLESELRRINIIRAVLSFARFVMLFGYSVDAIYKLC